MSDLFRNSEQRPKRSLIAYAFLAQATRGEGDLLSGLAPIFKPIARLHAGERFDSNKFSKIVEELYGLKVHPWAVENIAPRLENAGLLIRVQQSSDIHEYAYAEVTQEFNEVSEDNIRLVIHQFIEFAKPILTQNNLPIDEKALEDEFLAQLVDMNFVSILLKPDRSKEDISGKETLSLKKPNEQKEWEKTNNDHARIDVLCASFIVDAYHNNENLYSMLVRIASGALISEVILNFQDPGKTSTLDGLTIILDTPFLMSALDLGSEEAHAFAKEVCDQLRDKGAQLATFAHSVDELKDNLKAVIGNVRGGYGFGATARRLSKRAFAMYASAVLENPESRIKQENIRTINAPSSQDFFQFFSGEDQEKVKANFGLFSNYLAQERDAESIAGTIRLRRGKRVKMGRISTAGYLFVTENPWIVERTQNYLSRKKLFSEGEVPPAISERYLAGLLWVIFGGKGKDLSKYLLLANCAAALEPRSDVVKQMHRFLTEIDPNQAEFFNTLMTEERAGQYTMQLTLGDSSLLNKDNTMLVLEKVKSSLVEKLEIEKNIQIAEINAKHEAEVVHQVEIANELRKELSTSQLAQLEINKRLKNSDEQVNKLAISLEKMNVARVEERRLLVERCVLETRRIVFVIHVVIAMLIATLGGVIAWYGLQDSQNTIIKTAVSTVIWLFAFLGFWKIPDYIFGNYFDDLREKFYKNKLTKLGLSHDVLLYEVDWDGGRVAIRDTLEKIK